MEIVWSNEALWELTNYRRNSSIITPGKVDKYIDSLVNCINHLEFSPYLGKIYHTHENIEIRQLLYKMHRIFYYIQDNQIIIIGIVHTARNSNNILNSFKKFFSH